MTLGDEIEFAKTYLAIEQQRFEEKLDVEVEFDPSLQNIRVPAMILQPLVENAIKHGITPKLGPGWVRVAANASPGLSRVCLIETRIRARSGAVATLAAPYTETPQGL